MDGLIEWVEVHEEDRVEIRWKIKDFVEEQWVPVKMLRNC